MHENNESLKDKLERAEKAARAGDDLPYDKSDEHYLSLLALYQVTRHLTRKADAILVKSLREEGFELIDFIGEGGQGAVYEAKERVKGSEELVGAFAIKILSSDFDSCIDEITKMDRIKSEFIVKVHRPYLFPLKDGRLALVMDLVTGKSLYDYIRDEEKLTVL